MRKKLLSVALCATMVAGLLAGCGSSSKSEKTGSDSKGSVYWLNFKPEADEALQGIAKTYEKEKGVKVKVVTAASGNYNSTLTSEMVSQQLQHYLLLVTRQQLRLGMIIASILKVQMFTMN